MFNFFRRKSLIPRQTPDVMQVGGVMFVRRTDGKWDVFTLTGVTETPMG